MDGSGKKSIFDWKLSASLLSRLKKETTACKRLSFTPSELQYLKDIICRAINKDSEWNVYKTEENNGRLMFYYKHEETSWHALDDFPDDDETVTYYFLATVEKLTRDGVRYAIDKVKQSCEADSFKPDKSWTEWIKQLREEATLMEAYACFFETREAAKGLFKYHTKAEVYSGLTESETLCLVMYGYDGSK